MSTDCDQLRTYIVRPVLQAMNAHSAAAENLLMLTAAAESHGGEYIHQLGGGPACGLFQCEPATHDWLAYDWLAAPRRTRLRAAVMAWQITGLYDGMDWRELPGNWYYATAITRCRYLTVATPLPAPDDSHALAAYWKAHYNTAAGAGRVDRAVAAYRAMVGA